MISKLNKITLKQAIAYCISKDGCNAAFFCSRYDTVKELLGYIKECNLGMASHIKHQTGQVYFANGSVLTIRVAEGSEGVYANKMYFDEQDYIPYDLKQRLVALERKC